MVALPPEVLARLRPLRLHTRLGAATHGHGLHASQQRGSGLEFSQYRSYEQGDDLRLVDWKLFARSDRYFVREAERESPLSLWLVLDATASMTQVDQARPSTTRLDIAKGIAACAIQLALQGSDRFGLVAVNDAQVQPTASGLGARHRDRCLLALDAIRSAGNWPDAARLSPAWNMLTPRSLVLLLSDCFDDAVVEMAEKLAATGRDVCIVQLLMADERDFPYRGGHLFIDTENAATLLGDADALRADYLQRFAEARDDLKSRCAHVGIRLATQFADAPIDASLQALFGTAGRRQ
ncbi:MAG: DUF58 domain-containing protein [Thermomonas sp.]